jgi:hypothetical protein
VLRISVDEVMLPTFTTWGCPVRRPRTQLHKEEFRPYDIEEQAVVDEQHPHICIPFVQVAKGSVQCNGDCVVCGSVRVVGELERVECVREGGDMVFD